MRVVAIYTIFNERLDDAANTRDLLRRLALPFPAAFDAEKTLRTACGVARMGGAFLVDHTGVIRWRGKPHHANLKRLLNGE
ncbi:MAG: hypothetical protein HKN82_15110 [Akkermansiaceae bacterium]|nr:hypothetical protein [Akkermansiaceae bacterium]NNM31341.1 hypothetical protein [Akkermansiaceae bacterium]